MLSHAVESPGYWRWQNYRMTTKDRGSCKVELIHICEWNFMCCRWLVLQMMKSRTWSWERLWVHRILPNIELQNLFTHLCVTFCFELVVPTSWFFPLRIRKYAKHFDFYQSSYLRDFGAFLKRHSSFNKLNICKDCGNVKIGLYFMSWCQHEILETR